MSKPKKINGPKSTVINSEPAEPPPSLDDISGDLTSRIGDCRGAVRAAINAIVWGDADQIDAALGGLCLAERELRRLANEIDEAWSTGAGKVVALDMLNA